MRLGQVILSQPPPPPVRLPNSTPPLTSASSPCSSPQFHPAPHLCPLPLFVPSRTQPLTSAAAPAAEASAAAALLHPAARRLREEPLQGKQLHRVDVKLQEIKPPRQSLLLQDEHAPCSCQANFKFPPIEFVWEEIWFVVLCFLRPSPPSGLWRMTTLSCFLTVSLKSTAVRQGSITVETNEASLPQDSLSRGRVG